MVHNLVVFLDPSVHKPVHPFDVLRKASIQFEPYVMFVQVNRMYYTFMYVLNYYEC